MGPKRVASYSGVNETKKVRRPLTVAQKLDIIARLEKGERSKDICTAMNLSSSTVRTIYLQKDKLKEVAETCIGGVQLERITRIRDAIMEKLERLLAHWIDSHNQQNMNLSFLVIQEKALSLFEDLKKKAEEEGATGMKDLEFKASRGWFVRFKSCSYLHSLRTSDEKAGAEMEAAKAFPKELHKIIDLENVPKEKSTSISRAAEKGRTPSRTLTADMFSVKGETFEDPPVFPSTQSNNITPGILKNVSAFVQTEKGRPTKFQNASQSVSLVFDVPPPNSEETCVTVEYFGDELSAGETPAVEIGEKEENKDNVEVLFRLRAEKLLLELDKLRLERQKMGEERRNIELRADILSLRKQLVTECVYNELHISGAAPLGTQDTGIKAASSHPNSQDVSCSHCVNSSIQNSDAPKHLQTISQTDVLFTQCNSVLETNPKCLQSLEQTVVSNSSTVIDTPQINSGACSTSKHHHNDLPKQGLKTPPSSKTAQEHMETKNLTPCSKDDSSLKKNYVTEFHELVNILPRHSELTQNVRSERDLNEGVSQSSSLDVPLVSGSRLITMQYNTDLSKVEDSMISDFSTQKVETKNPDNISIKITEVSASLKDLGTKVDKSSNTAAMCSSYALDDLYRCTRSASDKMDVISESGSSHTCADLSVTTGDTQDLCRSLHEQTGLGNKEKSISISSSHKYRDGVGSQHRLKDSQNVILCTNDMPHKIVDSSRILMDKFSSLDVMQSSQQKRKKSWDLENYTQRDQSTTDETCQDLQLSSLSKRISDDFRDPEFGVTAQIAQDSHNRIQDKAFCTSKCSKGDVSDSDGKFDDAVSCKRIKKEHVQR